jgi:hypothetical protein
MRIWVLGDSGTANGDQAAVYSAYQTFASGQETHLCLMLGDNAYANNGNSDGSDGAYQTALFDVYSEMLRKTPIWPALGNHESKLADYLNMFTLPSGGESGGTASGSENYYSFDYGNVHFICLDSQHSNTGTSGPMYNWLVNDLNAAAGNYEWLIAFWHHPPYSSSSAHHSDKEVRMINMRERFVPVLEAYGVDLVLNGHAHNYQRTILLNGLHGYPGADTSQSTEGLIESVFVADPGAYAVDAGDGDPAGDGAYTKAGQMTAEQGTIYSVSGSSGKATHGSAGTFSFSSFGQQILGSLVLDIADTQLDATFIDDAGNVLDTYRIIHTDPIASTVTADAGTNQIVADTDQLNGEFVQLDGSGSTDTDGTIVSYEWSWNDGGAQSAIGVSPNIFLSDGTYSITLKVTDNDGYTDTDIIQVTVHGLVRNSGFELPVLASGGTTIDASGDWVQAGTHQAIQAQAWAANTGNQGVWLKGWTANLDEEFYQDVAIDSLSAYQLTAYFKANDNFISNGSQGELDLIWLDGSSTEISRLTKDVDVEISGFDWNLLTISGTAPSGAVTARIRVHWSTDGLIENSSQSSLMVDDISLIIVDPSNNAPVASNGSDSVVEDGSVDITLVATDADSDPLTYSVVAQPANGSVVVSSNSATYTPNADFSGVDSFTFKANDGSVDSNVATVDVTVTGVNDAPVFTVDPIDKPNATEGSAYSDTLAGSATDVDVGDSLTYSMTGPAWLSVAADGTLSGTPGAGDVGTNVFTVMVEDVALAFDTATLNIIVDAVPVGPFTDYAQGESTALGTVAGTLTDAQSNDDVYEVLTEAQSGGNPSRRRSELEHTWTFNVTGDELVTFYVEAHHSANSEGDDFLFAYSTDDANYIDMVTVTKTADDNTAQFYSLPGGLSGTVYVRVVDTDRSQGNSSQDSLYVDALFIVSDAASTPPTAATNPNPSHSATSVTLNPLLTWTPGMLASSHEVYFGTNPTPGPGEFQGSQSSTSFSPGALATSTTYYWVVDEVNSAGSIVGSVWSFTTGSGTPQMHVDAIVPGTQKAGKDYRGVAAVTIVDGTGQPVSGATVNGDFTGDFVESGSATTDANGEAVITTGAKLPLPFTFTFTVSDVTLSGYTYNSGANVETSDTY